MFSSVYIENKIQFNKVNEYFENRVKKYYATREVLMSSLFNNVFNKNVENQFTLYENLCPDEDISNSSYLLYYGNSNVDYYFFWTEFEYTNEKLIVCDIINLPKSFVTFNNNLSDFTFKNNTIEQLYTKDNNINFLKLFNEHKIRFYYDDEKC